MSSDSTVRIAMDLHGLAMLHYLEGQRDVRVIMHREDGFAYPPIPAARWFYENGMPILDSKALALCRGRVLNIGAASGSHSLFLEDQSLEVVSLDASANAVEVMRRRGVRQPTLGVIDNVEGAPFDTILLLCGIGVAGTAKGLEVLLAQSRKKLRRGGTLITDCTDPRADTLEVSQKYCDLQRERGKYEGERTVRFEYHGSYGPWFNWLAISPEVFDGYAKNAGFDFEVVYSEVGRSLCVLRVRE